MSTRRHFIRGVLSASAMLGLAGVAAGQAVNAIRITRLTPLVLGTPWRTLVFLKLETDSGLIGVSEVRADLPAPLIGYLRSIEPFIAGMDPFNVEAFVRQSAVDGFHPINNISGSATALIEMACWDIIGKALDQPVYRLLGGAVRERIKAYANGWYSVERTPEAFHAAALEVVGKGYRALKFDPFGTGFYDIERPARNLAVSLVEAVRDAVGPDVEMIIEMHGRFTPATAIGLARDLEPFEPAFLEEPVPPENFEALSRAAAEMNIPVAAGERVHTRYATRQLLEANAIDVLQTDITMSSGLLEGKKIAAMADAAFVTFAPHNTGGPLSTAACLHLAACTPNFRIQEHFNDFADSWVKDAAVGPGYPEVVDGYFALPEGPGLGVTLNEDLIAEHPPQSGALLLYQDDWHLRDQR